MYSKKQLEAILNAPEFNKTTQKVVNSLVTAMNEGKKLSLAEEEFLGIIVHSSIDDSGQHPNMHDYKALQNDLFRRLYPAYVKNRYGLLYQEDAYGEVPPERKKQDVDFLEDKYQEWDKIIRNNKHNSESLQHLASEVKNHLRSIDTFTKQAQYGSRLKDALVKEIVLHSKYLLYYVDEYYQELGAREQTIAFIGGNIVVDAYGYIHTLFRHYAEHIKGGCCKSPTLIQPTRTAPNTTGKK